MKRMYIHHDHPSRIPWKPGQSDGSSSHCPRHQFSLACHNTREGLCGGPETGKYTTTFVRPGLAISVTSPYTTHKKMIMVGSHINHVSQTWNTLKWIEHFLYLHNPLWGIRPWEAIFEEILQDHIPSLDERSAGSSCNSGFANHAKVRHSSTLLTRNSAAPYMSLAMCCLYNLLPISNGSMEKKCFQICNIFPSFSVDLLCFPWKISTAKHSPVPLSHRTWAVSLTMGSLFNKPGDGCHPWNQSHQESENARLLGWYNLACAMYSGDGYTPWISQVPTLAV